jgi:phage/plasmid-associated DNA primase
LLTAIAGLGFDTETSSWVLPLWNVHGVRYAAKLWRPSGGKWITAGWATTRMIERNNEPIGRLFDVGWFLDHLGNANGVGGVPWEKRWLWFTAGEWDCLQLRSVGWFATTSINGEASHPQPEMLLREFGGSANALTLLGNLRGIVVCFDVDDTGRLGSVQFVDALEKMISGLVAEDETGRASDLLGGSNWSGVRAIDLRQIVGWQESGMKDGWDISDLMRWSKSPHGERVGRPLLNAAESAGVGVNAARSLLGISEIVSSKPTLDNVLVSGIHLIEIDELLSLSLQYARNHGGSRAQGSYHFGRLASRKGWTLAELVQEDVVNKLIEMWDREIPKADKLTVSFVYGHVSRSFLDTAAVDDLNTDKANAYRLNHYFPFLVYHPVRGWLYWDGVQWRDGTSQVWDHAARISNYIAEEAIAARDNGNTALAVTLFKWAKSTQSAGRIGNIVSMCGHLGLCKLDPGINEIWDNNPMMLGTPNGVFDLINGKLLSGMEARNQYCSLTTNGSILLGDSGVTKWGDKWNICVDFWNQMLDEWHPDKDGADVVRMLQEYGGLCLRGKLDEALIVLRGSGRSGKSMLMDGMKFALGEYSYEISGDILTRGSSMRGSGAGSNAKSSAIAQMSHKRLIKITEVGDRPLDIDLLKTFTGETEMMGRRLYGAWGSVVNVGTFWAMTNKDLDLRGDVSEALRGRIVIVQWNLSLVDESVIGLDEYRSGVQDGRVKLRHGDYKDRVIGRAGETWAPMADVILTWMYEGLLRVIVRGGNGLVVSDEGLGGFVIKAKKVIEATQALWDSSDPLSAYFETSGLWTRASAGKDGAIVATGGLFNNWHSWAEIADAERAEQINTVQKFSSLLVGLGARGYEKLRSSSAIWGNGRQVNAWRVPWTWIGGSDDGRIAGGSSGRGRGR